MRFFKHSIAYLALITFFAPLFVLADSNNITALIFTTDAQSVSSNTLSGPLTVETINSANTAEKINETNDVTFTSTSGTGEFLNSSGGAVSTTMSTNTGTRTFYYEDSTPGTYTITVAIKGRTSGKTFSANQTITVTAGSGSSNSQNASTSTNSSNSNNGTSTSDTSDDAGTEYSYASQASVYTGSVDESFNVSIGRNRLASVGEPVEFVPKIISDNPSEGSMAFHWAFGDGTEWDGVSAYHTYAYPGTYTVVLEASRFGDQAAAQTEVKVVNPLISIVSAIPNVITLQNAGDDEVNLGGWIIADGDERFTVPEDTIINAHATLMIPGSATKTKTFVGTVTLFDPSLSQKSSLPVTVAAAVSSPVYSAPETEVKATTTSPVIHTPVPAFEYKTRTGAATPTPAKAPQGATSAASVIYSVPKDSGSFLSGIGSWFGALFKK